jgi:hypothetical protein
MSITIPPEDSPNTGFAGDTDAEASAPFGADHRSMTEEPEERAGWPLHTAGFAGDVDKSMTEPEEERGDGWRMVRTDFADDGRGVGTETTTALRFGWGV